MTVDSDPDIGRCQRCMSRSARHEQDAMTGVLQRPHRVREADTARDQAISSEPFAQAAA